MKRFKSPIGSNTELLTIPKNIEFRKFDLPNGLQCFLCKDDRNPIVNVALGYKVGSKDEEVNKKGIAHLFEHMMFQGSENIGKNEHFQYVMKSGGISNAFTMHDATVYFETMPSNGLEMALWLESDRMNSLDITEENLSNQKSVVIEEKKQIYDNAPYGTMFHNTFRNVFKGSNYETPVIGEIGDINSFSVKEAVNFHENYYSPGNSVLIINGDIEYDQAEDLVNKYFGRIEKENSIKRSDNIVNRIEKDMEITVHDNIQLPVLNICYQIPKAGSEVNYAFEYLVEIIANNKSSRLYKKLVYEKKLLKSIKAIKYALEDAGIIIFRAMLNPGVDIIKIKEEILNELDEFAYRGTTDEEFQKIKNQIEFYNTIKNLKLQNNGIETVFNHFYFNDVSRINSEVYRYMHVKNENVTDAAKEFILNKNKVVLTYLPKN